MGIGESSGAVGTAKEQETTDTDYEKQLVAGLHTRTGMSARLLRQLLNGARVAARGGIGTDKAAPVYRGELRAWTMQVVRVVRECGGAVRTRRPSPGVLGSDYDARMRQLREQWRQAPETGEVQDAYASAHEAIRADFIADLFAAHVPILGRRERSRLLAVAIRLAGPDPTCRGIEVQACQLLRMAEVYRDETFKTLIANIEGLEHPEA